METPTTPEATPSMAVEKEAETLPDAPACEEERPAHGSNSAEQPAAEHQHDELQDLGEKCSHLSQQYEHSLMSLVETISGQATQSLNELLLFEVHQHNAALREALEQKWHELTQLKEQNDIDEHRLQQAMSLCQGMSSLSQILPPQL